jgi:hypothetical protein
MLIKDLTGWKFHFLQITLNQMLQRLLLCPVMKLDQRMVFFPFCPSQFSFQFLVGLLQLTKLQFCLLVLFLEDKKLIGDKEQLFLGVIQSLSQLIAEVFEHDLICFFHFADFKQMIEFLFDCFEFLQVFQLR